MGEVNELTVATWPALFDEEGRTPHEYHIRKVAFFKGVHPSIRPAVWKFLLGHHAFTSTAQQRAAQDAEHRAVYAELSRRAATAAAEGKDTSFLENCKIIGVYAVFSCARHWLFECYPYTWTPFGSPVS